MILLLMQSSPALSLENMADWLSVLFEILRKGKQKAKKRTGLVKIKVQEEQIIIYKDKLLLLGVSCFVLGKGSLLPQQRDRVLPQTA